MLHGPSLERAKSRPWNLRGKLTAGPFLRQKDGKSWIGCIVDRTRLVWIDPNKEEIAWQKESLGDAIVGLPQIVEGKVLVAEESGRFTAYDPATGTTAGPGYTLKASVGPAATPVAYSPGRAFVPLTDGTVLLLSMEHFGNASSP